ncbi:MAG: hypothetical protein HY064_14365 [Bacteroidetes bacterium]|nr:hypothetical protein [Bacteroidota bacterium]
MSVNYFILERDTKPGNAFVTKAEYSPDLAELMLKGESIVDPPLINLFCDKKPIAFPDLLSGVMPLPIVSSELKTLIESSGDMNAIFFKVNLYFDRQSLNSNYWLMHILKNVDAFNWEKSDYIAETWNSGSKKIVKWTPDKIKEIPSEEVPTIDEVKKIILLETAIRDRSVFRVNGIRTYIFCNDSIRDLIISHGMTGIYLADPLNYDSWRM